MKSFTDHPHIAAAAADGTEVGAILLSSDDGAISPGISIAPTEGVDGSMTDGEAINGTLQSATTDIESPSGLQRKGLRVSFPEFEVVSGYMDPPRPWNDVSQCSTAELIASYLNSCDKVGVKPITRLLSQLQVITNFDDRNETLTLKNENLDSRHCETLEEVFRRVQFRTIDLEATKLEEEGAVTIFDMIEYYESCLKLNISYSKNLGQRGWQACSRMIRKTPCLENLEARGAVLSDFVMPILGRSLRVSSSLTSLHLEFTVTSGKPLQVLVAALKVNETLKELYLADNKLLPSDGIQLGSLLRYNRTLHLLDLRNNHLQDTGFLHICEGVWEQTNGCGLSTLVMWNNQLSYQAMSHLSKALLTSTSLETINLGHNNLTNEGMHRLKESLLKNKTLLRIGLQAAKITCEGAVALAEFIAESIKLMRLDLRENEIKTGGLMALSLALKVSQSVTRIDLDKGPKKESGVKDYADQQKRLLNDITTYMQRNRTLARQREEEEIALESERLSSVRSDEQLENDPEDGESGEETFAEDGSDRAEVRAPEDVVVVDDQKEVAFTGGESSPRHRMNLTLELKTRCETLESPDFIPESEMPPADFLSADAAAAPTASGTRASKRKVIFDIPPSPMVSSQGRTILVPILAGPLSPSFDEEEAPPDGAAKSEDFALDSTFHLGSQDQSLSSPEADESPSKADELSGFWRRSDGSPLSSLGSNSSSSSVEDTFSPAPLNVDSRLSHLEDSLTRTQKKKSSLKMTRPKHRFQVSKATLSYKSANRRGSGGSHKTPHVTTEHSRKEEIISPSLTAFHSTFTVPLDVRTENSENSKLVRDEDHSGIDSYSIGKNDFLKRDPDNLPPVENRDEHEDGGLQKNSLLEPLPTENVSLHENYKSPAESVTKKSETAECVGEFVSSVKEEIQGLLPSFDNQTISVASDDVVAGSNHTSSSNSGPTETYHIEDQMNKVNKTEVGSCIKQDKAASAGRDNEADNGERNESQEPCNGSDLVGKAFHVSNGFALNLLEHETDLEAFGDEVNKSGVRKAPSSSSDNLA